MKCLEPPINFNNLCRSKNDLNDLSQLVYENYFDVVYANNNVSELDSYPNYNYSYYEYDYISNKTTHYFEPLTSDNGMSKFCNYFNTTQSWRNFLIFNFVFLYLFPVFIMSTAYGLIIKKVSYIKNF